MRARLPFMLVMLFLIIATICLGSLLMLMLMCCEEGGVAAIEKTSSAIVYANNQTATSLYASQETGCCYEAMTSHAATPPLTQIVYYLAAPEGSTGPIGPIGCGSYLVPAEAGSAPAANLETQITYTLTALLNVEEQVVGQSGLFNALALSSLTVDSVEVDTTESATVHLSGDVMLSGVCSDAIFAAQLEYTAQQFPVSSVTILINDVPLADVISGH